MEKRFVVDQTLGKLAKWLRCLGFDTALFGGNDLHRLVQVSQQEGRIILTRNRGLEPKLFLGNILIIREDQPDRQLLTVLEALKLPIHPRRFFTRCLVCNRPLEPLTREEAETMVPEFVHHRHRTFRYCPSCHRIYWEGSHRRNMRLKIERLLGSVRTGRGEIGSLPRIE